MTKTRQELDLEYENGGFIPDAQSYADAWEAASVAFRVAHAGDYDVAYGDHERAKFDLIRPEGTPKGLFVFVHGGYWLQRHKDDWTCYGEGAFNAGWAIAHPGYPLAPEARIGEITAHIAQAVTALAARVEGPIVLAGHSAGGHLVARMAMAGVLPKDVADRLSHVLSISPVSDLRPLLPLTMNDTLRLDEAEAEAESPALGKPLDVPITVVVGAQERPVFLDQARWLSEAWGAKQMILPGRHHFDVIDGLRDADSPMMKAALG
ncbi:alpha/beta hydrolase family protein [Litoreibacter halocynthiae]|uniref:Alpha/beta hydrolase family protein n=1 Tax=Litoreibacter halocynthiae TaxID=1242689 RepID=A0A4R7LKW5_9RHOB|nr:alpha/beta hydrolase [Litoreibacter halocynthiae]TDT75336.1 alpha/beta hydrolase family protein [Litoreibacter halocynthiae]